MTFFSGAKKNYLKKNIFSLHISSSYAKILGETNFHAREIPRSGWKVEGGERRKKKKKKEEKEKSRWKQWPASLRQPPRVAHASTPGPKCMYKREGKLWMETKMLVIFMCPTVHWVTRVLLFRMLLYHYCTRTKTTQTNNHKRKMFKTYDEQSPFSSTN